MSLRELARGRPCMVRLPGCDGGGETTVLAHYRLAGLCGIGMKPQDIFGAWACRSCHDYIDGRADFGDEGMARIAHANGVMRTLDELRKEGHLWTD